MKQAKKKANHHNLTNPHFSTKDLSLLDFVLSDKGRWLVGRKDSYKAERVGEKKAQQWRGNGSGWGKCVAQLVQASHLLLLVCGIFVPRKGFVRLKSHPNFLKKLSPKLKFSYGSKGARACR